MYSARLNETKGYLLFGEWEVFFIYVCVCVCERDREKERERQRETETERGRGLLNACVDQYS